MSESKRIAETMLRQAHENAQAMLDAGKTGYGGVYQGSKWCELATGDVISLTVDARLGKLVKLTVGEDIRVGELVRWNEPGCLPKWFPATPIYCDEKTAVQMIANTIERCGLMECEVGA